MVRGYEMPKTLSSLYAIDQILQNNHGRGIEDYLGIYLNFSSDFGYDCTPDDAVVFGHTGMGGDHFAFFTNNDSVSTLEEAPIIFIQPMLFEHQVKLVANNLCDFLSLFLCFKELYILERFDFYKTKKEFLDDYELNFRNSILEREDEISLFSTEMTSRIKLRTIEDAYDYIMDLRYANGTR
ncbi:hypothetical protein [Paenibacillus gansuensis]|uniref:Knr4/Smi1-like domain-containing protein n=1 Tax=Paenibacillus gansuensis TaxID=306542 RepID=A0ABW5PFH8_9BACL